MVHGVFRSVKSFDMRHSELCWEREVYYLNRERGFRLLYQSIHGDWGSTFYSLLHVAELLLDVLEPLLQRLFPLPLMIRGLLITSVVPSRHPLIATISGRVCRDHVPWFGYVLLLRQRLEGRRGVAIPPMEWYCCLHGPVVPPMGVAPVW